MRATTVTGAGLNWFIFYLEMIKEAILVGGVVFYAFVITSIVSDIRTSFPTQAMRTSPNPSSESLTMMRTVL